MAGFNDVNGIPLSANRRLVTEVLRHQLHFDGFVVSDWDAIRQMMAYSGFAADKKDAARLALYAGVDMDMADRCYLENMEALVSEGAISIEELDEAVRRILSVKLRMGLFDHPNNRPVAYDTPAHLALAQRLAEESIVLLKNEKQLLPLDKQAAVGFAGPYLHNKTELVGSWALDTNYRLVSSPAEAIRSIAPGAQLSDPQKDAYLQVPWLRDCQMLVLMLGERRQVTGEAHCLAEPTLPAEQLDMARKARRLGIPVVGVFCFAAPSCWAKRNRCLTPFYMPATAAHGLPKPSPPCCTAMPSRADGCPSPFPARWDKFRFTTTPSRAPARSTATITTKIPTTGIIWIAAALPPTPSATG